MVHPTFVSKVSRSVFRFDACFLAAHHLAVTERLLILFVKQEKLFDNTGRTVMGIRFQVITWFMTTFSINEMKSKVHHIPGLEYLYQRIPPDQLDLPDFVLDYDMRVSAV